ncbi:MAG: VPEID-CTERM sorting domain-containing protein [Pseudomonadota bacterium]
MKKLLGRVSFLTFTSAMIPMVALAGRRGGRGGHGGGHHHGGGGGRRRGGGDKNGHDVPEIDIAEGLAAVAILIAVLLLLREFNKRRAIA